MTAFWVLLALGLGGFVCLTVLFTAALLSLAHRADVDSDRWLDERRRLP